MIEGMTITGLDSAATIPVGAILVETSWRLARFYGPGAETFATMRDALVKGIAERESERRDLSERLLNDPVRGFSIDLRWHLTWEQGTPDANGRPTYSSGLGTTIQRYTYATLDAARAHLANIDRYTPPAPGTIPLPPMRNGDTVTVTGPPSTMVVL